MNVNYVKRHYGSLKNKMGFNLNEKGIYYILQVFKLE